MGWSCGVGTPQTESSQTLLCGNQCQAQPYLGHMKLRHTEELASLGCSFDPSEGIPFKFLHDTPLTRYSLFFYPSIKLKNRDPDKNRGLLVKERRDKINFYIPFSACEF
ncbi:hypothetical protein SADUNF_Sadunf13G0045300 [Salix dunnii]|uniref:Uncharacterized protein n=1 Tax=Salix dunnii TaxID=1413687 RepID=A0A835JJ41_9ROSI|nr:hypothetical protein SADUNF_Sadunf13G0045300 [Salix dunnii]